MDANSIVLAIEIAQKKGNANLSFALAILGYINVLADPINQGAKIAGCKWITREMVCSRN